MVASKEGKALTFRQWHQEINNILIQQGLQGYTQKAIVDYFKNRVDPDEVVGYLELLLKENKVQKFRFKKHYYWRATIHLPTQQ